MDDAVSVGEGRPFPRRLWRQGAVMVLLTVPLGCGPYVGTTASSFLRRIREDADPNIRYLAYSKLGSPNCYDSESQKDEAAKILVERLQKGREPVATRAVICRTLGALGKPVAREAMLQAVNDPDGVVRVEACRALGKVGRTEDATVLARIMATDTLEDCRVAAVEALGHLKPDDPRISRVLVDGMIHADPAIRLASLNALRSITQRDLGTDPAAWSELVAKAERATPGDAPASPIVKGAEPAAAPGNGLPIVLAPPESGATRDPESRPASYPPQPPPLRISGDRP